MDFLVCVLCELNAGHPEPLYPHDHHDGQIPLTPCKPCYVGQHDRCKPLAPYWCSCDCGLVKEAPVTLYIETVVQLALSQSGDRYVYGAKEPASDPNPKSHGGAFDCSGLIAWAVRRAGGTIPDGSEAQYDYCKSHGHAISITEAERTRGALLFLGHPATEHVVISLGNGSTIEARGAAYGVGSWNVYRDAWNAAATIPGFTYGQAPHPPAPPGYALVVHLQAAAGMPRNQQDGHWGPITDRDVKRWQGHYNDPHVAAIQRVLAVNPDGDWGPHTEAAFEAARRRYYRK